jgi:Asp-tRNA(Asn)/Glu-tRNA(Gln) amidotransferase C subunit
MRKFEKKINQLNLVKGKLSKGLNANIKDFEMLEQSLVGLQAELREAKAQEDNDEEVDRLTNEVEELEQQLENFDEILTDKVQSYSDNYEVNQEKVRKMDEARKAKAAARVQATPAPAADPTPAPAPEPTPVADPTPAPAADPTPAPKVEEKEEKGTNWLLWGVLGVAGIFVGINLFKNKR